MLDMPSYEVMIPVYWEQLDIISWSVSYILENLQPKRIVLVGPKSMSGVLHLEDGVEYVDGNSLLEGLKKENVANIIDQIIKENKIEKIGERSGWYFQQFIKMSYANITTEEEYIVWDADMVPINPIKFFNEKTNKRIFVCGGKHHHMVYYNTMSRLFGENIKPTKEETYVAQYMMINCKIMKELTNYINQNEKLKGNSWWEKILYTVNPNDLQEAGFSEFETYGEFVNIFYPESYEMKIDTKKITNSRKFFNNRPDDKQIEWIRKDFDYLGFESWVEYSKFWSFICYKASPFLSFKTIIVLEQFRFNVKSKIKYKIKKILRVSYSKNNSLRS